MKVLKRILLLFLAVLLIVLISAFIMIRHVSHRAIPNYNVSMQLKGLHAPVEVYRDSFAVPHVYAMDEHDLYMATGYLLAEDRLWQMDMLRRVTEGRLSEIFGKDYVDTDWLLRALRFRDKSERILTQSDSASLIAINAFAAGVNQYMEDNMDNLPPEFAILGYKPEKWEPYHTLNMIGYMAWDLKAGWNEILMSTIQQTVDSIHYKELLPDLLKVQPTVYPLDDYGSFSGLLPEKLLNSDKLDNLGADILDGSNNWVVSGKKSLTGKPLLANDMHLGLSVPGIWYQIHQIIPGKLNVTGIVLPGAPVVICGHNDSIAWGMTNTYVDNLDFYEERINPEDSLQYAYKGKWQQFEVKEVVIKIKGGLEVTKKLIFSHRGPVVSSFKNFDGKVVTMHWAGDEMSNELTALMKVNRAHNWKEFTESFRTFVSISQNIAYADVGGNIGIFCAAGIPIRNRDIAMGILPGDTDKYNWKGYVPFEELPRIYNPSSGFLASANNRTIPADFPYHIGTWYSLPNRYERIIEMLSAKEKLSIEDFQDIQLDQRSKLAEKYTPVILKALGTYKNPSSVDSKAYEIMKKWDYTMSVNSSAAAIFENFYVQLIHCIYADELKEDLFEKFTGISRIYSNATDQLMEKGTSLWFDDMDTPEKEELNDVIICAFSKAVSELSSEYGSEPDNWQWGKMHQLALAHPLSKVNILNTTFRLNPKSYPVGGSFHTVSPFSYNIQKPFKVEHGSSHRHIYDLNNWDNSLTIIPTGNSGIPASKHYCDQTDMYVAGKYHADYFSKEKVVANAKYHMVFQTVR